MNFSILLAAFGSLFAATVLAELPESDNQLYPPVKLPRHLITRCDFKRRTPCKVFFNYARSNVSFGLRAEDANRETRTKKSIRYITTGQGAKGVAKFGSHYLEPSQRSAVKALCVSFRYRLTGDAKLMLAEKLRGISPNVFWRDFGNDESLNGQWRFHTSQVTSNSSVKIIFKAKVNGGNSSVALADIKLYNHTCQIKDGDTFEPYTGASRSLVAPYWPVGRRIPYEIQPGFLPEHKHMIERFLYEAQFRTCLQFAPRRNEPNYINFMHMDQGYGCASSIGNVGESMVALEDGCFRGGYWNIAHMILHVLGFRHEHIRPDRDNYVQVFQHRVDPRVLRHFQKRPMSFDTYTRQLLNIPYDYKSVLHFLKDAFSINGQNTIQKINDPNFVLANTDGPTDRDFEKIAAIYCGGVTKAPSAPVPTTTPTPTTPRPAPSCNRINAVSGRRGDIRKGRDGSHYAPNENCGWLVTVENGKLIQLEFLELELENSQGCSKDRVTIYDGSDTSARVLARICGTERPVESYVSRTNQVFVQFTSDSYIEAPGFKLRYRQIDQTNMPAADAALSPADCNFDQSACNWFQGHGQLMWSLEKIYGLPYDHTTQTQHGHYLSLNGRTAVIPNQYALLQSSKVRMLDKFACLSFYYRFSDNVRSIGKLQVYYSTNPYGINAQMLWSSDQNSQASNEAYSDWVQAQVDLTSIPSNLRQYRVIFNATISQPGKTGGIAVDDVVMTQDSCQSDDDDNFFTPEPVTDDPWATSEQPVEITSTTPGFVTGMSDPEDEVKQGISQFADGSNGFSCDFETDNCNWKDSNDRADATWKRASGQSTPGDSEYGVQADRSTNSTDGTYILLNSANDQAKTARFQVSVPGSSGFKCFELSYHMHGMHLGRMRVLARKNGQSDDMVLFQAAGNKQPGWTKAQVNVEKLHEAYTLIVEGYTTGQQHGDIGVDDFLLRTNDCHEEPQERYVTPEYDYLCDFEDGALCQNTLQLRSTSTGLEFADATGGHSSTSLNGPYLDHSQKHPQGHFAAARGGNRNQAAAMQTKVYDSSEANCMTFWYFISTVSSGAIRISIVDESSGSESVLFTASSANGFLGEWINPQVRLPQGDSRFSIKFTALSGGQQSFIAIDDVELSRNSKCSRMSRMLPGGMPSSRGSGRGMFFGSSRSMTAASIFGCRFGDNNFCDLTSSGTWQAVATSADRDIAGPDDRFAHLTSGSLLDDPTAASSITGTLTSKEVDVTGRQATESCLYFFYKISGWFRGLPMDTLNVFVSSTADQSKRRLVASLSGSMTPLDSVDDWAELKLTIFESDNYQIIFEGTTSDSWLSTIAVDDVQLKNSVCTSL